MQAVLKTTGLDQGFSNWGPWIKTSALPENLLEIQIVFLTSRPSETGSCGPASPPGDSAIAKIWKQFESSFDNNRSLSFEAWSTSEC